MCKCTGRVIFLFIFFCAAVVCFADVNNLPDPDQNPDYYANKWLLITKTETSEEKCTCEDGVVLNTNLYENLKNGLFVCIRYASAEKQSTEKELVNTKKRIEDAYTKFSGGLESDVINPGVKENTVKLIKEVKRQDLDPNYSYSFRGKDYPAIKVDIRFSSEKMNVDDDVPPAMDFEADEPVLEKKIIEGFSISFAIIDREFRDSVYFEIIGKAPVVNTPKIKIFKFGYNHVLVTSEYYNKYEDYLVIVVGNSEGNIEYSKSCRNCTLEELRMEKEMPTISLYTKGKTVVKMWNGKNFTR
ncbi:MAG: hypothetical protein ACOCYO_06010 [Bacteroidota bacterium]